MQGTAQVKNPKHQKTVYNMCIICETLRTHVKIDFSFSIVFMQKFNRSVGTTMSAQLHIAAKTARKPGLASHTELMRHLNLTLV